MPRSALRSDPAPVDQSAARAEQSDAAASADYIHALSGELAALATSAGLDFLAYLLDMVRQEADLVKTREREGRSGPPKPIA